LQTGRRRIVSKKCHKKFLSVLFSVLWSCFSFRAFATHFLVDFPFYFLLFCPGRKTFISFMRHIPFGKVVVKNSPIKLCKKRRKGLKTSTGSGLLGSCVCSSFNYSLIAQNYKERFGFYGADRKCKCLGTWRGNICSEGCLGIVN